MTPSPFSHRLTRLDQKLNRLRDQKARLMADPSRAHRTRTLIQLGGLILKSGWLEAFDIEVGSDLQNIHQRDKAATLLGALMHLSQELNLENQKPLFHALGLEALNQQEKV